LTGELLITLIAVKYDTPELSTISLYNQDSNILSTCCCLNAFLGAINTITTEPCFTYAFVNSVIIDTFISQEKFTTSFDVSKHMMNIFFVSVQYFSSRIDASELKLCKLLFLFLSSKVSYNMFEISFKTLKHIEEYHNFVYQVENFDWNNSIHILGETLTILSFSKFHPQRHQPNKVFELIFRLESQREEVVQVRHICPYNDLHITN